MEKKLGSNIKMDLHQMLALLPRQDKDLEVEFHIDETVLTNKD